MIAKILIGLVISYAVGSFSIGYHLAQRKGSRQNAWAMAQKSQKRTKSGEETPKKSVGTTQALITMGPFQAIAVAIFDIMKGIFAITFGTLSGVPEAWTYGFGITAVIGAMYPFYIGFRGGNGTMAALGACIGCMLFYSQLRLWPYFMLLMIVFILFQRVSSYIKRRIDYNKAAITAHKAKKSAVKSSIVKKKSKRGKKR